MNETTVFSNIIKACSAHSCSLLLHSTHSYLYDWDDMQMFGPKVHLNPHVDYILPPEARGVDLPVHATVSSYDVYVVGQMLSEILCRDVRGCKMPPQQMDSGLWQVHDLANKMMTKDPDERPSAGELLKHAFFKQK